MNTSRDFLRCHESGSSVLGFHSRISCAVVPVAKWLGSNLLPFLVAPGKQTGRCGLWFMSLLRLALCALEKESSLPTQGS